MNTVVEFHGVSGGGIKSQSGSLLEQVPQMPGTCKFMRIYKKEPVLWGTLYYSGTNGFKFLQSALPINILYLLEFRVNSWNKI